MRFARVIPTASLILLLSWPAHGLCAEECRSIVLAYDVYNPAPTPVEAVVLYCLVPQDIANQTVLRIVHDPPPDRIETDKWGQKLAVYPLRPIPPKTSVNIRMIVWAKWEEKRLRLDPAKVGPREAIPEEVRRLYLCNRSRYQIASPEVQKIVKEKTTPDQNLLEAAKALHDFTDERVYYDMDGEWDDAVTVLKRGTGSCSEFTFAFIALCRAAGIPARYVGGTKCDVGAGEGVDLWNHRWPEVYLPGYGWVPADRNMFGVWRRNALILACGDGGEDSPIGWDYKFGCRAPNGGVLAQFRAYWAGSLGPDADQNWLQAASDVRSRLREKKLSGIQRLGLFGKPLGAPYLAEGLSSRDEAVVDASIEAMKKIKGRAVAVALTDTLGKAGGAQADERTMLVLRQITGERFASTVEWGNWLAQRKLMGLRIKAFIDGRSKLVLTRGYAQWFHYTGMPPGLGDGRDEPTYLENFVWKPRWSNRKRTYGDEVQSAPLRLTWPYPGRDFVATLDAREAPGEARLLDEGSDRIAILLQNTSGRPAWFDLTLRFEKK